MPEVILYIMLNENISGKPSDGDVTKHEHVTWNEHIMHLKQSLRLEMCVGTGIPQVTTTKKATN